MQYTNITYEQLLEDFKARLSSDPRFKNITSATIYQMFMEMICACMDMTNFYIQRTAEESFIDTAKLDSSIIKHGKNLGYSPRRPIPARCDLQFVIKGPLPDQTRAGDEIVFNQDIVDLSFDGKKFILDKSYSYKISSEDLAGIGSSEWEKVLTFSVPSENVTYLPLQGKNLYNRNSLQPISCFQAERKTMVFNGNAYSTKIGKIGQFYDIDDLSFSNWYSRRDPYAFYKDNYQPKLSWTKVGIGTSEEEAMLKENLFTIEDVSIYLNETLMKMENIPPEPLKICKIDTNWDKTVRIHFSNDNYMVSPGLTKANQNIYVQYLSTEGRAANRVGTVGNEMQVNNSFYLNHSGDIIDITNNIQVLINSDVHSGEDFETNESIKINAPAYYSSRNKLVTKQDFVSYFRGISTPLNVQTALVYGQHEIEDDDTIIYKYMQNYVFYSLIGHMYLKTGGKYKPRNVLTDIDEVNDPFSIYANEYMDHIADYVKMVRSFESFYNTQYNDNPESLYLRNLKTIRDNCQSRMEINSRILSIPPMVQYFDLVGNVKVSNLTKLQDYKDDIENKIYEYLDNRNGMTQKIYKSDLIKFFNDKEETVSVDVDLKVSSIVKSDVMQLTWENQAISNRTLSYGNVMVGGSEESCKEFRYPNVNNITVDSVNDLGSDLTTINRALGTKNWFNAIEISSTDLYCTKVEKSQLIGKRMEIILKNRYKNGSNFIIKNETYIVKVNDIKEDDKNYIIYPQTAEKFGENYYDTVQVKINLPIENDFFSKSTFSVYKTDEYKLPTKTIKQISNDLNKWLNAGTEVTEADRAITLPYKVYTNNTVTREETYFRKGNVVNNYENTISEKAFWMYFIPSIIDKYYYKYIDKDSDINSSYWRALSILIFDLYALCKPGFCDNILDAHNNIVNFSMENEVAVVRIKVAYNYDTVG